MRMRLFNHSLAILFFMGIIALGGCTGPDGKQGEQGPAGPEGGPSAATVGTISGTVRDSSGVGIRDVSVQTLPASATTTSATDGTFTLSNVSVGSYSVTATKAGYSTFTLANVAVAGAGTTNVSLVLQIATDATGVISGTVTDSKKPTPTPLAGVVVGVQGSTLTVTTGATGAFTFTNVVPGPVFLSAFAPSASYLDTETLEALLVTAGGTTSGVKLVLSARPTDAARYIGTGPSSSCVTRHRPLTSMVPRITARSLALRERPPLRAQPTLAPLPDCSTQLSRAPALS